MSPIGGLADSAFRTLNALLWESFGSPPDLSRLHPYTQHQKGTGNGEM